MQQDAHVRQRNFLFDGLIMTTRLHYPNTWRFSGEYRPELCRKILAKQY